MDADDNRPIGEPQPIDTREGRKILKRMAGVVVMAAGGLVIFAGLLIPTRTSGASRSARLQWLQRQKEIQEVIKQNCPVPEKDHQPASNRQEDSTGR
jgi:hypothetical protein